MINILDLITYPDFIAVEVFYYWREFRWREISSHTRIYKVEKEMKFLRH